MRPVRPNTLFVSIPSHITIDARAIFEASTKQFPPEVARPIWEHWARYEYQYGDLEGALKLEKRMAEVFPGMAFFENFRQAFILGTDPPIKRFAQRHMYSSIDAIASRDLGAAVARKSVKNSSFGRQDTVSGIQNTSSTNGHGGAVKRPGSPDYRKREEHKRPRANSPVRDRERWTDGREGPSRRRYSPPPKVRERERPPPPRREIKEEEKPVTLPHVLHWFHSQLPPASVFDGALPFVLCLMLRLTCVVGPIFRTDDLVNVFRNAVIPSSNQTQSRARSPPAPPRGGAPGPGPGE